MEKRLGWLFKNHQSASWDILAPFVASMFKIPYVVATHRTKRDGLALICDTI